MKIITPPIPGIIPCESKSVKIPLGSSAATQLLNEAKVLSMKSIGIVDQLKIDWKIKNKMAKKIK
ncbi:hypothetical protein D3C72_508380 [compost metagenome]